jgi:predicted dehydrogenase
MRKFNVGIVGYGWAASAHIPAIDATNLAQVTAVYSARTLNPAELSSRHGRPIALYNSLDAMLSDSTIDVVSICSYPHQHADHIVAAAAARKALIIEKPITLTLDDARRVEHAVQASGCKSCVCFEGRYSNQLTITKAVIDDGLIGTIHYAEVDYFHGIGPWYGQWRWNVSKESGGSSLLSAGCHALNALLWFMGNEVESIVCRSTRSSGPIFSQYQYDSTSVSLVQFSDGRLGKVASVIDCMQPYYFHVHLIGSEGSILDNKFHSERLRLNKHAWSNLSMKMLDSGDVADHPYQAQFEAFFRSLAAGTEMPLTSLTEAMKTHRVVLAADIAAVERRAVKISELT